MAITAGHI